MFAEYVREISKTADELGPFDAEKYAIQLAAIKRALNTPRLRWMIGMEYTLKHGENVYQDMTRPELLDEVLDEAIESEFHKGLIMEAIKDKPLSVSEMSAATGLPVYTISLRLNELESDGLAEFDSHEGSTPKFATIAA